jgi:DNA-directed RNA polymerase specialized sigma24 family protein
MSASSLEAAWLIGYVGAWQSKEVFGDITSRELGSVEEGITRLDGRVRNILHQATGDPAAVDDLVRQVYRRLNAALREGPLADFEGFTVELARDVGLEAKRARGATERATSELHFDSHERVLPAIASGILDTWQKVVRGSRKRSRLSSAKRTQRR